MAPQLIANIVVLACIYALVSIGYVLVYRTSRVLNLAHGELMMMGAYLLVGSASLFNQDPVIGIGVAVLMGAGMGMAVYFALMRWMTGKSVLAAVLVTIALGILLRGLIVLGFTAQQFYPA